MKEHLRFFNSIACKFYKMEVHIEILYHMHEEVLGRIFLMFDNDFEMHDTDGLMNG